ncbi:MAG: 3-dehydroquinate synthase [Phycisphaerae bacterium]|nr:3-dehydroquinate synthase [Phycisphaerae bacterium]
MTTLTINFAAAPSRSYEVVVGPGVLSTLGSCLATMLPDSSRRACLISDDCLPPATIDAAAHALKQAGFKPTHLGVHASEADKSLSTFGALMTRLASTRHERNDPIISLGGGIVGDLAGFVAATYRRGVPVVQCPTTLLSMVDASVGGKTGVNIDAEGSLKKNMVGAFWQPVLVLADTDTLGSLPERHLRSGLAECLKHALISHATDPTLFDWTLERLPDIIARRSPVLTELIARNIRVKASFVTDDEREEKPSAEGGRALLNLGHTFAHAIETLPHLSPTGRADDRPLHHGEAVALGLLAAAHTSLSMNRLTLSQVEQVRRAVEAASLPTKVQGLPEPQALLSIMMHDKKVSSGRLRLILPVAGSRAEVVVEPPMDAVLAGLRAIRG